MMIYCIRQLIQLMQCQERSDEKDTVVWQRGLEGDTGS